MDDVTLLHELTPVAERLFDRHLRTAKEWFPHTLVPWERAATMDAHAPWDESRVPMPAGVRSALFVNLLTEDNLPYYFRTIEGQFGRDEVWGEWARRWTAEEGRHAIVIRDYLTVTESVDPFELERARMLQVSDGTTPDPDSVADTLVYVALQELATRIAHRNTGTRLEDPAGYEVMARVAADENLHHLFYRDAVSAALEVDPSTIVVAIQRQVRGFQMPGVGITDFQAHAHAIARAGIYDLPTHHEQILVPVVLRHWRIEELTNLSDEAERARDDVLDFMNRLRKISERRRERESIPVG
jgi:acyl-[acyl-carrier-protein] desaturase